MSISDLPLSLLVITALCLPATLGKEPGRGACLHTSLHAASRAPGLFPLQSELSAPGAPCSSSFSPSVTAPVSRVLRPWGQSSGRDE